MFKIVAGGQTGVDRAALDCAIKLNIIHSGYCPKDRKSEDGSISKKYNLIETHSNQYNFRTRLNVINSDATLILFWDNISGGTKYTLECCKKLIKPIFSINMNEEKKSILILHWIKKYSVKTLNIAGPREDGSNIYNQSKLFLESLFNKLIKGNI